ncbi:5'-methylthioadenosine/S-adenosylhomocysteine nucleosidase [Poseidonocella sp. HB161398]|uniref:5'-methylthioadenosine/S-adenosylhomocysteine nucleosidase n=1 Tax=Poseidonocella sp. HB161398 TaxID=2320855 RepID=UPI0011099822|nr:5'-methylthioadenosine/S-adenosylhomocysteine nucleosidase [Poseidonocella sp. HB161398]
MTRLAALCLASLACPAALWAQEPVPRVAVMSAFAPEWGMLVDALEGAESQSANGVSFVTGRLAGQDVVLFLSGISMVNAAMTTQLALDTFDISAIVFSGIAGGVDPSLHIGDVVVAGQWGSYLEALLARETEDGYMQLPFVPTDFPNYGMIFPKSVEVMREGIEAPERKFWFEADPGLLATAETVAAEVEFESCAAEDDCLSAPPEVVVGGNGVSGMAFLDNADFREYVFDTFDAQVVDMESAAVAQVAWANQVPFIAFRSLSDLAGGGEGENEMGTFFALAAANSATLVTAFLAAME